MKSKTKPKPLDIRSTYSPQPMPVKSEPINKAEPKRLDIDACVPQPNTLPLKTKTKIPKPKPLDFGMYVLQPKPVTPKTKTKISFIKSQQIWSSSEDLYVSIVREHGSDSEACPTFKQDCSFHFLTF